jgi:predicted component of type VI protein secretion system
MKVSLVVASGAHEGRVIPLTGPQFLIGRDQQCHLRPASQAISKLHCAVLVRDGKVYVKDFGSTNGTLVNEELIQNAEVQVSDGTALRVGPLDFRVQVELPAPKRDGTPLPGDDTDAALAAVKAAATAATVAAKAPARDTTPNPARPVTPPPAAAKAPDTATQPAKPAAPAPAKPAAAPGGTPGAAPGGSKEGLAVKPGTNEGPSLTSSESITDEDHDRIAAMLLGMDEEGNKSVPDGSTVMDIPTPLANNANNPAEAAGSKSGEQKKDDKAKVAQSREDMTSAASDLLRKYMRRPK